MSSTTHFENIADEIIRELSKATIEIKAALAWFTDTEIINLLESKASNGIKVELILAQNEHNEESKYSTLKEKGAEIIFVPSRGYGSMHNKFCIIDKKVVINGSYNWTINARKNNNENIVIHHDFNTVENFLIQFNKLKMALESGLPTPNENNSNGELKGSLIQTENEVTFRNILDSIISAEVSQYNRSDIRAQGYEAAQNSNGDPQVLPNCFDSLYSGFVSSIDLIEEKKRSLLSKIEEQKTKSKDSIEAQSDLKISQLESANRLRVNNLQLEVADFESKISLNKSKIEKIQEHDIVNQEIEKKQIQEEIDRIHVEFVRPKIRLYELIPTSLINIGLIVYLFLFYSSAAYILLFSKADFEEAQLNGIKIPPPEVFNPQALSMAADKGGGAVLMLVLFVFIPLTLATVNRLIKSHEYFSKLSQTSTRITTYLAFILVDAFIAYSVTKSIYDIARRRGDVLVEWEFSMIWSNPNFYLVFVMGALGLFLFDLAFEKLMITFEERNPDHEERRRVKIIAQKNDQIKQLSKKQESLNEQVQLLNEENTGFRQEIIKKKQEVEQIENLLKSDITAIKSKERIEMDSIERISDIYKTHVMNDQYAVSVHAIRDRVNTFLDGWITYLNDTFSVKRAREFTNQSNQQLEVWSSRLNLKKQMIG